MAASSAAQGIRAVDDNGTIAMISRESERPYSRPGMSKALWRDPDLSVDDTYMPGPELPNVTFVSGVAACGLDTQARLVTTSDGSAYRYGKLILATSGDPQTGGIEAGERIRHYRNLEDYRTIRRIADAGGHVVVAGGGFIGQEMAAVLAACSPARVTWIITGERPGDAMFPSEITAHLDDVYRKAGVDLKTGTRVHAAHETDEGVAVTCKDGTLIEADALVTGFGLDLDLDWIAQAGIDVSDEGVVCDENGRTSDPNVYACGDIAAWPDPIEGRRRYEHKVNALWGGEAAGRSAAGQAATMDQLPYFYSFLFDDGYEALGRIDPSKDCLLEWIEVGHSLVAYYRDDDKRLTGILLWNLPANDAWDPKDAAERLLRERRAYDSDELLGAITPPEASAD